jgi:hypothetical protein
MAAVGAARSLHANDELHLRMDGAQHHKGAGRAELDIGTAAGLLIAGIELQPV